MKKSICIGGAIVIIGFLSVPVPNQNGSIKYNWIKTDTSIVYNDRQEWSSKFWSEQVDVDCNNPRNQNEADEYWHKVLKSL